MKFEIKQRTKLGLPRYKKAYYGFYALAAITVVILSFVL